MFAAGVRLLREKRGAGDPTGALRRGGFRRHEKLEAARSAPTSIRQGQLEDDFCPRDDHGLCLEELAAGTRHARGKRTPAANINI